MSEPDLAWYANGQRVVATFDDGTRWWIAPDGFGEYVGVPGEGQNDRPVIGASAEAVLRDVIAQKGG